MTVMSFSAATATWDIQLAGLQSAAVEPSAAGAACSLFVTG